MKSKPQLRSQGDKISHIDNKSNALLSSTKQISSIKTKMIENESDHKIKKMNTENSLTLNKNDLHDCNISQKTRNFKNIYNTDKLESCYNTEHRMKIPCHKNKMCLKNKNYNYNYTSVCSINTKNNAIKLFYSTKSSNENKIVFYKDLCVTGEKIALWKKIKSNISFLTSGANDKKVKSTLPVNKYNKSHIYNRSDDIKKIKFSSKPFYQKFWNLYCKCSFNNTSKCSKLPLIQFPDIPERCVYTKCDCFFKKENGKVFHKLHYSKSCKCCPPVDEPGAFVTKTNSVIVVKTSRSTITSCHDNKPIDIKITKYKNVACIQKCSEDSEKVNCKQMQDNSTQCCPTEDVTVFTEDIVIEHKCSNTQEKLEIGCGDHVLDLTKHFPNNNEELPFLKKIKERKCKEENAFFKLIKKIHSNAYKDQETCCTQHNSTQTYEDDKRFLYKNKHYLKFFSRKLRHSVGIQCTSSLANKVTLTNCQDTRKISIKEIVSKSYLQYKSRQRFTTIGTQCERLINCNCNDNTIRAKSSKKRCECKGLVTFVNCKPKNKKSKESKSLKKYLCIKKPFKSTGTQCAVSTNSVSNMANDSSRKFWYRKTPKQRKSDCSVMTIKRPNKTFCKNTYTRKLLTNTIGVQCHSNIKTNTCTKNLYYTRPCKNNLICRKSTPPCSSIGTQFNSIYFKTGPQRLRLKNKKDWSLFNMRKPKSKGPCTCVKSLMLINDAYRNYCVTPALCPPIKCDSVKGYCSKTACYRCKYCGDFCRNMKLNKQYPCIYPEVKSKCSKDNLLPFQKIQYHSTCRKCKRKNKTCFKAACINDCPICSLRRYWALYPYAKCEFQSCHSPCYKSIPCKHKKTCKMHKRKYKGCKNCRSYYTPYVKSICRLKRAIKCLICGGQNNCACSGKCRKRLNCRQKLKHYNDYNNIFSKTMRRVPYKRIYRSYPWAYPECLKLISGGKHILQCTLVAVTWILWCPFIVTMELFRFCFCHVCYI